MSNSQKVNQILYIPKDVQILLNRISNTLCKPKSQVVAELIENYAEELGKDTLVESKKVSKVPLSRFDVVRSTILQKLYGFYSSTNGDAFTYAIFCRFMAQPPVSVSRECVINDYLRRMISLGYILPCECPELAYRTRKGEWHPESKFELSDEVIKSQGKLEGL